MSSNNDSTNAVTVSAIDIVLKVMYLALEEILESTHLDLLLMSMVLAFHPLGSLIAGLRGRVRWIIVG